MRELLMLRHGMTESNERRTFTGAQDVPLSARGEAELRALRGSYPPANRFFTSGMLRARQTLALLYGDVPSTDCPDLAEVHLGVFEGHTHDELYASSELYRRWLAEDGDDVVCLGGESRAMFRARIRRGFAALADQQWTGLAVLISHGGVIRTLLDAPSTAKNGCGFRLVLDDAGGIVSREAYP